MSKEITKLLSLQKTFVPLRLTYFIVKTPDAAKRLTNQLITSPNDSIILPFADHPGPLFNEILSRKFRSLTVCEPIDEKRELFHFHVKRNHANQNIHVYPDDLFDLSYKSHCDQAQQKCSNIVKESLTSSTEDFNHNNDNRNTLAKLLVPLLPSKNEASLLRNLYYQMSLRIGLCLNTFVHYYFLMSERQFTYLNAKPSENFRNYRSSTILYNTLFNVHKLETFDLKSCFGIGLHKIQKTSKNHDSSYKNVHLVWLQPRLNVLDTLDSKSLMEYRFLVNQMMHKRTGRIVKSLEKWFENCGSELEQLGITKSSRSGDLSVEQYYKLYLHLKNREDYSRSIFLQAVACAEENFAF